MSGEDPLKVEDDSKKRRRKAEEEKDELTTAKEFVSKLVTKKI